MSTAWAAIAVRGSADFRREAWIEANARAMNAQGYKATAPDRQEAGRAPEALAADDLVKALRALRTDLSPDGRLVPAGLSETIDRQMNRFTSAAKAGLKRFVAAELLKTKRTRGPVALTAAQAQAARSPARAEPAASRPLSRTGPDPPHRSCR